MKKYAVFILVFSVVIALIMLVLFPIINSLSLPLKDNLSAGEANNFEIYWGETFSVLIVYVIANLTFFIVLLAKKKEDKIKWLALLQLVWLVSLFFLQFVNITCFPFEGDRGANISAEESPPLEEGVRDLTPKERERMSSTKLSYSCYKDDRIPLALLGEGERYGTSTVNPLFYLALFSISIIMIFVSLYFVLLKEK
jgi:hypothetical protein